MALRALWGARRRGRNAARHSALERPGPCAPFRRLQRLGPVLFVIAALVVSCVGPPQTGQRPIRGRTVASCGAAVPTQGAKVGATHRRVWLLTVVVLDRLSSDPAARLGLAGSEIYAISARGQSPEGALPGITVVPTMRFTSEALLAQTLARNALPRGVRAVAYDNEDWSLTPADERLEPIHYYRLAARLAREHGLQFVATPGWVPGYHGIVTRGASSRPTAAAIVPAIAACANVVDIQAQEYRLESSPSQYLAWVRPIAIAARHANPDVIVVSGLSTNPLGGPVTSQQLVRVARASQGVVQGWWLNLPPLTAGRRGPRGYGVAEEFLATWSATSS